MRTFIIRAVAVVVISAFGLGLFFWLTEDPPGFQVTITNNTALPITGYLLYLDQKTDTGTIEASENTTQVLDLRSMRKKSGMQKQVGQVLFRYRLGQEQTEREMEVFGYIEPGDSYLDGKRAVIQVGPNDQATIELLPQNG